MYVIKTGKNTFTGAFTYFRNGVWRRRAHEATTRENAHVYETLEKATEACNNLIILYGTGTTRCTMTPVIIPAD